MKDNKFDIICNTVDNGIIVLNKDLTVLFWNKWLEIRTGIQSSTILNKKLKDFYSNIDENKLKRKVSIALKINSPTFYTPQTDYYLMDIKLKNISNRVFEYMQQSITISPLDTQNGLVVLYIYDITLLSEINHKLKLATEELSQKNEELRLILDATMEAIIIFRDDKVVDCNKIALELLNKKDKSELINRHFEEIVKDKNIIENVNKNTIEAKISRDDGSKFCAILNVKDTCINERLFKILTIVDIEEIKRKEYLMAEQSKLAAMGEMLANIAHQWRQPLNIISITASNLKLNQKIDNLSNIDLSDSLSLILKTTEHLSNTIDTFNDFLKTNKTKVSFSVCKNIQSSIALISSFFKKFDIQIILDLKDDATIYNVENEFSQAIVNILHNAKDAIAINVKDSDKKLIKISTKRKETQIDIYIQDNALGVKEDIINKIFEPYFTTKHQYQGIGLGLYMTRKIISSMGGKINVKNTKFTYEGIEYKGASFKISIPIKLD